MLPGAIDPVSPVQVPVVEGVLVLGTTISSHDSGGLEGREREADGGTQGAEEEQQGDNCNEDENRGS